MLISLIEVQAPFAATDAPASADVCRERAPGRHDEYPLDGSEVRWVVTAQPLANGPPTERGRCVRHGPCVGRVERGGQLAKESCVLRNKARLAGEDRDDVAARHLAKKRDQLVADAVSQIGWIAVGDVLDRLETKLGAQPMGLGATKAENRVPPTGTHSAEAVGCGAPEQVDKDRLGLVVGRVARGNFWRQDSEAGGTRPRLKVGASRNVKLVDDDLGTEGACELVDHVQVLV
jgi:hypothetical protein